MLRRTIPALHLHILLLLAALFNAMAGVPLHEARHIREAVRSAQVASAAASGVQADAADEARRRDSRREGKRSILQELLQLIGNRDLHHLRRPAP